MHPKERPPIAQNLSDFNIDLAHFLLSLQIESNIHV